MTATNTILVGEKPSARSALDRVSRRRRGLMTHSLLLSDAIALAVAFSATLAYRLPTDSENGTLFTRDALALAVALPLWLALFAAGGLYRGDTQRIDHSSVADVVPALEAITMGIGLYVGIAWLLGLGSFRFPPLAVLWGTALTAVVVGRLATRQVCRRLPTFVQSTLIVGTDDIAVMLGRKLLHYPEYGLALAGYVGEDARHELDESSPVLGTAAELPRLVTEHAIERVIIAGNDEADHVSAIVHTLKGCDVEIDFALRVFESLGPHAVLHRIEAVPLVTMTPTRRPRVALALKRTVDVVVSLASLVIAAPLFAWIAWRIHRDSPGPVFFRQTRLGQGMRPITVFKFRTMTHGTDPEEHRKYIASIMDKRAAPSGNGLYKLERREVTPFGRWLRRTSLDELPQLINVLRGEMSLVGPRPCLPYEVDHFEPHHFTRFDVPAGITGLWQVVARARATFVEALEMDVAYARGWSLSLDLWLLARTPLQLLTRKSTT